MPRASQKFIYIALCIIAVHWVGFRYFGSTELRNGVGQHLLGTPGGEIESNPEASESEGNSLLSAREDSADPSISQFPAWADDSELPQSYSRFEGSEFVRYQRFIRRANGEPIIVADHFKSDQQNELLESYAFNGNRLLIDNADLANLQAVPGLRISESPSGAFATLHVDSDSSAPFNLIDVTDRLLALGIQGIEYDVLVFTTRSANDSGYSGQWHLVDSSTTGHIDAERAWETRTSAAGVVVAVLDTGVRLTHEDLAGNLWVNSDEIAGDNIDNDNNGYVDDVHGADTRANSGNPNDDNGHGTHVAGIIGAEGNNSLGVTGVAWDVDLMAIRFMDSDGVGYISDALEGIEYAYQNGADIVNCSFATGSYSSLFLQSIERARDADTIIVAAAGNENTNLESVASYPAAYSTANIVSVASTDSDGGISSFSNYSNTLVDLAAPGRSILATYHTSNSAYASLSGTSMAAPVVSGVLALARAEYPNDSYQDLIDRMESGVISHSELTSKTRTGGYVSLFNTLSSVDPSLLPNIRFSESGPIVRSAGFSETLTVESLNGSPSYSWQLSGNPLSEQSQSYTWGSPTPSDSGTYSVLASNEYGTDTASIDVQFLETDSAIASTTGIVSAPWITYGDAQYTTNSSSVVSGSISHNQSTSLQTRSPAEGTLYLDIEISTEANYDFLDIILDDQVLARYAGEVSLSAFEINFSDEGQILVFRYSKDGTVTRGSDSINLSNFRFEAAGIATITSQPSDLTLLNGQAATVAFTVENATGAQYQWIRDGQTIATTNVPQLQFYGDREPTVGTYTVEISGLGSPLTTASFTVSNLVSPQISRVTGSSSLIAGETLSLNVEASGQSLSYQWVKDNQAIDGAQSATYTLSSTSTLDSGMYWVIVSNQAGSASSSAVNISVNGALPSILSQPESQTVSIGESVTLQVIASSESALTYTWYHEGALLRTSDTNTLLLPSITERETGTYTCTVSNPFGSVTTNIIVLSLTEQGPSSEPRTFSLGGLQFEVFYETNDLLESASNSWTIEAGRSLVLRSTVVDTGVYAFDFEADQAAPVWRVNGSEIDPHEENERTWITLSNGDVVDCVVSSVATAAGSGGFTLSDIEVYLEARGPVVLAPTGLQIVSSTAVVEDLVEILSNSAYRIDWTLASIDSGIPAVSSQQLILNKNTLVSSGYYKFSGSVENSAGIFALPEFYINLKGDLSHPFSEATTLEGDWISDPQFGVLNIKDYPWVYSVNNGWWYIDTESIQDNQFWIYDYQIGWMKSGTQDFPYAWSRDRNSVIYIYAPRANERWIYDFATDSWSLVSTSTL
ncbi:MAG: S8 family serine peptidase [Verrucomicrobiota bacterium]